MTFGDGAKLIYTDQARAEQDFEMLRNEPDPKRRAVKLEKINPMTMAVLD